MIELDGISKTYDGKGGVAGVSLTVAPGEVLTLFGPSGCGKTTLLRIVAGLLEPDGGDLRFDGRSQRGVPPERRQAPMVFQDNLLFPHLTVRGNVAFGLKLRREPAAAVSAKVDAALASVQLSGFDRRWPAELSGGQKQRVALARALVLSPRVLLLDEPFSALDAALRAEMRALLRKLWRERPVSTILVTHDADEAFELSGRVAVILGGRVRQIAAPGALLEAPADRDVAAVMGNAGMIDGLARDGVLEAEGLKLPLSPRWQSWKGPATAVVRDGALTISDAGEIPATIDDLRLLPSGTRYRVRLPSGAVVEARGSDDRAAGPVRLAWDPARVALVAAAPNDALRRSE